MADALALTIQSGRITRLQAGDRLLVQEGAAGGLDVDAAGLLELGASVATSITIGSGGAGGVMTTVAGDLTVTGNEIVNGTTIFNGATMQIGDALTDTLEIRSVTINNSLAGAGVSLLFDGTVATHLLSHQAEAGAGAGGEIGILGQTGGTGDGAGGIASIVGGTGGVTNGVGGVASIQGGAGAGSGADGAINIGTASGDAINSGLQTTRWTHTGIIDITQASVLSGTVRVIEALELSSTGTGAETASIIVGNASPDGQVALGLAGSLFLDGTNGAGYIKTDDTTAWSLLSSGAGNTLNQAYVAGNTIAVEVADGPVAISNSEGVTDALTVTRSFVGAGRGLFIDMGSATATTGIGLEIATGATATGDAQFINNAGSGAAFTVQDGGSDVFDISGAGAITVGPTAGQSYTLDVSNAGVISLDAATGAINVTTTSGTTAGAVTISSVGNAGLAQSGIVSVFTDAANATATGADVRVGTTNSVAGGTPGGVQIRAGEAFTDVTDGGIDIISEVPTTGDGSNIQIRTRNVGVAGSIGDILVYTEGSNGATIGGITIQATGAVASASTGVVKIEGVTLDLDGETVNIDSLVGGVSIDAATASNFTVTTGQLDIATVTSGDVVVSTTTAGDILLNSAAEIDLTSAGILDINSTGAVTIDGSAGIAIEMATASTFNVTTGALTLSTTTSGDLTLSTTTAGDILLNSAAEIDLTSAGILDINSTGAVTIDGSAGIAIEMATASSFNVTTGNLTLSTTTSGDVTISTTTAGDIDLSSAVDISFAARGQAAFEFNDAVELTYDGTATSVIGALNELFAGVGDDRASFTSTSGPILAQSQVVAISTTGTIILADADGAGTLEQPVGLVLAAVGAAAAVTVVTSGEVTVPDAAFTGSVPTTGGSGVPVYMSTTPGLMSLTAPASGGDTVAQIGIVSFAAVGVNTTRVVVGINVGIAL